MPVSNATNATDQYRAKAYELLFLAERAADRGQRADLFDQRVESALAPSNELSEHP